jgi:hypothetical protein
MKRAECSREPQFQELYPLLGDPLAQDKIRADNPGRHCGLLIADSECCTRCQLGPYHGEDGRCRLAMEDYGYLVETAQELDLSLSVGMKSGLSLSSQQFEMLIAYREAREFVMLKMQIEGTINGMAALLGGKQNG